MSLDLEARPVAGSDTAPILVVEGLSVHYDTVSGPAKAVNERDSPLPRKLFRVY